MNHMTSLTVEEYIILLGVAQEIDARHRKRMGELE
jgi:hypothetical protein